MRSAAIGLTIVGVLAIVGSYVWPDYSVESSGWTRDQAASYTELKMELHRLSQRPEDDGAYDQAKQRFDELQQQLDASRARSQWIRRLLWLGGMLAAAVGAIGLLYASNEKASPRRARR